MNAILNKKFNLINLIRDILVIILILWSLNPMLMFYNVFIQIILFLIWLILALFTSVDNFRKSLLNRGFILSLPFPLYLLGGYIIGRNVIETIFFIAPFIHFIFWYYYNLRSLKSMKSILICVIFYYILIAIYSINALSTNDFLARILANGDQSITIEYAHPLLANFNYIYSATLLLIAIIGVFVLIDKFKINLFRSSALVFTIIILFTVINKSQYAVALVLSTVFSLLMVFLVKEISYERTIILLFISLASLIIILNMKEIMYWFASQTNSRTLQIRFTDIGNIFGGDGVYSTLALSKRVTLYTDSIDVFKSNPIFGMGKINFRNNGIIGGHSEVFDNLGYYGLLGSLLLFISIYSNFKNTLNILPNNYKKVFFLVFLLFICYSILNLSYFQPFLIILYIVTPILLLVYSEETISKSSP